MGDKNIGSRCDFCKIDWEIFLDLAKRQRVLYIAASLLGNIMPESVKRLVDKYIAVNKIKISNDIKLGKMICNNQIDQACIILDKANFECQNIKGYNCSQIEFGSLYTTLKEVHYFNLNYRLNHIELKHCDIDAGLTSNFVDEIIDRSKK